MKNEESKRGKKKKKTRWLVEREESATKTGDKVFTPTHVKRLSPLHPPVTVSQRNQNEKCEQARIFFKKKKNKTVSVSLIFLTRLQFLADSVLSQCYLNAQYFTSRSRCRRGDYDR